MPTSVGSEHFMPTLHTYYIHNMNPSGKQKTRRVLSLHKLHKLGLCIIVYLDYMKAAQQVWKPVR